MTAPKTLIVDDDLNMLSMLRRVLGFEGFAVTTAEDGEQALQVVEHDRPDVVVLDVMLPGMDGLEVCRRLRAHGNLPILLLTARDAVEDRVTGLNTGADDYLAKPFAVDELLARLQALLRRAGHTQHQELGFTDLRLREDSREVTRGTRRLHLTPREFDLLRFFLLHPRQALTRELIFQQVWQVEYLNTSSNIIDVFVRELRAKLEAAGEARLIHTLRGIGYILREA